MLYDHIIEAEKSAGKRKGTWYGGTLKGGQANVLEHERMYKSYVRT